MATRKIGINGRFLQHPFTGIGQYTIQLLKEFSKILTETSGVSHFEFLVVVPDEMCVELMRREGITLPVQVMPEISWGTKGIRKHYWEQMQLPKFFAKKAFDKTGADVVWLPYPCVPWWRKMGAGAGTALAGARTYYAVSVHDVIPWTMPEYSTGIFSRLAHVMSRRAVRRAEQIITVSQASKNDIVRVCNVPNERIHVIHNGVSETFFHPADPQTMREVLGKYALKSGEYFLYVGGYDARKRVGKLVEGYGKYTKRDENAGGMGRVPAGAGIGMGQAKLVLVGGKSLDDTLYRDFDLVDAQNPLTNSSKPDTFQAGKIVKTGFLDEESLNALYESARAFLHFSAMEGFNIPLAQALVKHTPSIVSDIPVHHEIAGDSATYLDPEDAVTTETMWKRLMSKSNDLTRATQKLTNFDPELYHWSRSAKQHLEVFADIIDRSRDS